MPSRLGGCKTTFPKQFNAFRARWMETDLSLATHGPSMRLYMLELQAVVCGTHLMPLFAQLAGAGQES